MSRQPVVVGGAGDKAHHGVSQGDNNDISRGIGEDGSDARCEHHPLDQKKNKNR